MEPTQIDYGMLESMYVKELSPDDCVVDAAAVIATDYHYRHGYSRSRRIAYRFCLIVYNIIPSALLMGCCFENKTWLNFFIVYIPIVFFWLSLLEIWYRKQSKKPDMIQFFFISKECLFVNNFEKMCTIPLPLLRKIYPIKRIKNQEHCAYIDIRCGIPFVAMQKVRLYAGIDDAERMYRQLCDICDMMNKKDN